MKLFRNAGLLLVKRLEGVFMIVSVIKDLLSEHKLAIVSDAIK